jgi:L-aspartate oxidase
MCGGVPTDLDGQTSLPRLFAVGESACTGVHGANRLASNSLLEGLFFADRASVRIDELLGELAADVPRPPLWDITGTHDAEEWVVLSHDRAEIRDIMWDYVGLVRSTPRLRRAERRLTLIAREVEEYYKRTRITVALVELRNLAQVALLIALSALSRRESRGLHYMTDYPEIDPAMDEQDTLIALEWETISGPA